jgi:hypothetical protein
MFVQWSRLLPPSRFQGVVSVSSQFIRALGRKAGGHESTWLAAWARRMKESDTVHAADRMVAMIWM